MIRKQLSFGEARNYAAAATCYAFLWRKREFMEWVKANYPEWIKESEAEVPNDKSNSNF